MNKDIDVFYVLYIILTCLFLRVIGSILGPNRVIAIKTLEVALLLLYQMDDFSSMSRGNTLAKKFHVKSGLPNDWLSAIDGI